MEDVAVGEAETALQVQGREDLPGEHAGPEVGRVDADRVDHQIGELLPGVVPAAAIGKVRGHVLHEQAGDVLARRRQRRVEHGGDQHLDHRLFRPAVAARIAIGAVEVIDGWADDDAGAVMVLRLFARPAAKIRQIGQGHVHAEGAGARLEAGEA